MHDPLVRCQLSIPGPVLKLRRLKEVYQHGAGMCAHPISSVSRAPLANSTFLHGPAAEALRALRGCRKCWSRTQNRLPLVLGAAVQL